MRGKELTNRDCAWAAFWVIVGLLSMLRVAMHYSKDIGR